MTPRAVVLPASLVVLWSSGFVGATMSARTASAETTLLWRFVVAAALLSAWASWRRRRYDGRYLARQAAVGVLGQGCFLLGVFLAADLGVPAGTSALVASFQPALAALLLSITGSRLHGSQLVGLGVGLVGVLLVVGADLRAAGGPAGLLAVVLGTVSLTVATVLASRWEAGGRYDVVDGLAVQSVVGLGLFAAIAAARGELAPPPEADFWLAITWLVVLSFFGGYGSYLLVLRRHGPLVTSALLYLTPGITAAWAWIMLAEQLTPGQVGGLAVSLAGVCLVLPRSPRPRPPSRREFPRERIG